MRDKLVRFVLLFVVIAYLVGIITLFILHILHPLAFIGCCVISVLTWVIGIRDSIVVPPDDPNF